MLEMSVKCRAQKGCKIKLSFGFRCKRCGMDGEKEQALRHGPAVAVFRLLVEREFGVLESIERKSMYCAQSSARTMGLLEGQRGSVDLYALAT